MKKRFVLAVILVLILILSLSFVSAVYNNYDTKPSDNIFASPEEGISNLRDTRGIERDTTTEQNFEGYIVQFKEEPSLVRKINLEKEIKEEEKKIEEATPIIGAIPNIFRRAKISGNRGELRKLGEYKQELKEKHRKFLSRRLSKITGKAVDSFEDKEVLNEFTDVFNGIALDISKEQAEELKKLSEVKKVYPNLRVNITLMDSVPLINADDVWAIQDSSGNNITGQNVTIAIIDTGVDYTHADLGCKNDDRCGNVVWPSSQNCPIIYGSKIVWQDYSSRNSTPEIYLYDLITKEKIKIAKSAAYWCAFSNKPLDIYEDKVVWLYVHDLGGGWYDYTELRLYNISSGEEKIISRSSYSINNPSIYGNKIVWSERRNEKWNIYMYDLLSGEETQITYFNDTFSYAFSPEIYGNKIVWTKLIDLSGQRSEVFMYDISTGETAQITSDPSVPSKNGLTIYEEKIIWITSYKSGLIYYYYLHVYDFLTKQEVSIPISSNALWPSIYGNKIALGGSDIYMYDLATGKKIAISTASGQQNHPHIFGNNIVWEDYRNGLSDIYMYDLSRNIEFQLTDSEITNLEGLFPNLKIVGGYDFVNLDADPLDDHGHGTHVAGIAAGNGVLKGVAPDAKIYAYKVLSSGGSGTEEGVIAGVERAVQDGANIISMSLGAECKGYCQYYYGTDYCSECGPDDPLSQAIDNVVDAGVVAVIAGGNSGSGEGTINSPGTARKAITVGASYKKDYTGTYWMDVNPKTDQITSFSSRGPVIWSGGSLVKPDIVAPGAIICSAQWYSAWDSAKCFDNKHVAISGTSMATPHIAGAVALIKQAHPGWSPEEIEQAIKGSAIDLGLDENIQGAGRIDALAALGTITQPVCGNNIKEQGEVCDGSDLANNTCISLGYDAGNLSCLSNCSGFDTSNCVIKNCIDNDKDNYSIESGECGLIDCNDNDADIHPGNMENCVDLKDNDCDSYIDCQDSNCKNYPTCAIPDLITHYKFENNVNDETGKNNGSLVGGIFSQGEIGQALSFDGNDYVEVPSSSNLDVGESYSIAAWINPSSLPTWQSILERGTSTSSRILLWLNGDEITIGTNSYWTTTTANLQTNNWYHVVSVHDGSNDIEKIYLNGVKIAEKTGKTSDSKNTGILRIGTDVIYGKKYYFKGKIDDVRLYNKVLSEQEILDLFSGVPPPPVPVCGNNIKETGEVCDLQNLSGQTCLSQGFSGGNLSCLGNCSGFDISNCVSQVCTDNDNDGYYAEPECGVDVDCNDNDADIHPGNMENCVDLKDNDCDSYIDCQDSNCEGYFGCAICTDNDLDSYSIEGGDCGLVDCNDTNANIHPNAVEVECDNIDQNCDDVDICTTPIEELIAYYKFDFSTGEFIEDSADGNHGNISGATFVPGKIDNSLNFDGNDFVWINGDSGGLNVGGSYSITMWINPTSLPTWQALFERGTSTSSRILLWLNGDEVTMGTNTYWSTTTANLQVNNWYHIVAVHDGSSDTEKIYLNGNLIATNTGRTSDAKNTGDLIIGNDAVYSNSNYYFKGKIDEVRLYKKALSDSEIAELFGGVLPSPPIENPIIRLIKRIFGID